MPINKKKFRVVTCGHDGEMRIKDYPTIDPIVSAHEQVGVEDCSTNLSLRGMPIFRGLIGPMTEAGDRSVVRYESPEVFERLTKEWMAAQSPKRRRRRRVVDVETPV